VLLVLPARKAKSVPKVRSVFKALPALLPTLLLWPLASKALKLLGCFRSRVILVFKAHKAHKVFKARLV
jgi:hypothetical protein